LKSGFGEFGGFIFDLADFIATASLFTIDKIIFSESTTSPSYRKFLMCRNGREKFIFMKSWDSTNLPTIPPGNDCKSHHDAIEEEST
jgi:hypothetical protein